MRFVSLMACLVFVFTASLGFAGDGTKMQKGQQMMNKGSSECMQKCEQQKEQCFGQYKKSDMTSGTYITPEGHKVCWEGFHACKNNCPK